MMLQVYIPAERAKALKRDKRVLAAFEKTCKCKIEFTEDDALNIASDDPYCEFNAKNVVYAFGRGFEPKTAELLAYDDNYFSTIDLGQLFGNEKRIHQVKSRVIGENGRTKKYIESVSGAKISVYGDTISFLGSYSEIDEAEIAVRTIVEGGTHKLAYLKMEAAHRKNKNRP